MSVTLTTARTRDEILEEIAELAEKSACAGDSIDQYEILKEYVSLKNEYYQAGPK